MLGPSVIRAISGAVEISNRNTHLWTDLDEVNDDIGHGLIFRGRDTGCAIDFDPSLIGTKLAILKQKVFSPQIKLLWCKMDRLL